MRELAVRGSACEHTSVSEAMTRDLIVVGLDDDLKCVMSVMTQQRIRHLPIMESGDLVGLASIGDVVKTHVQ